MIAAAVVVGSSVVLFIAASARLFIWPAINRPAHVDAIVALAGDDNRIQRALTLAHAGYAPVVVISTTDRGTKDCPQSQTGFELVCFRPSPASTAGEAKSVAGLAAEHGWHRLLIVPGTTQATRARLLFKRCYKGQLVVVPARESGIRRDGALSYVVREWAALAKALVVRRSC
jgi:uncharacterized SAM-binding protein YcdF (DUF218 family)